MPVIMFLRLSTNTQNNRANATRLAILPDNWRPLPTTGQLELKDADYEVVPGLTHGNTSRPQSLDAMLAFTTAGANPFRLCRFGADASSCTASLDHGLRSFSCGNAGGKKETVAPSRSRRLGVPFLSRADAAFYRVVEDGGKLRTVEFEM